MTLTDPEIVEVDIVPAQSPEEPKTWQQFAQLISAGYDRALDEILATSKALRGGGSLPVATRPCLDAGLAAEEVRFLQNEEDRRGCAAV